MNEFTFNNPSFTEELVDSGIVTNGLVLNLDAGNPASYFRGQNVWMDLTLYNNDAKQSSSYLPYFSSSVDSNNGNFIFNGTGSFIINNTASLQLSSSYTFCIWANFNGNTTNYCPIVSKVISSGTGEYELSIDNRASSGNTSCLSFRSTTATSIGSYANTYTYFFSGSQYTNHWTHIGVTMSPTGSISAFRNGIQYSSSFYLGGVPTTTTNNICIGSRTDGSQYLSSSLASVQVYNRVLSPNEILLNFNATKGRYGF